LNCIETAASISIDAKLAPVHIHNVNENVNVMTWER